MKNMSRILNSYKVIKLERFNTSLQFFTEAVSIHYKTLRKKITFNVEKRTVK